MPIQINSLINTLIPQEDKKALILSGDTFITCQGRKYLVLSKGANRATPSPPVVQASNKVCDDVARKRKAFNAQNSLLDLLKKYAKMKDKRAAKKKLWVIPL